jgi:hypothetical protein
LELEMVSLLQFENRLSVLKCLLVVWALTLAASWADDARAQDSAAKIRIGIIGLDTSHAPAFTKILNAENRAGELAQVQVVVAYAGGSQDIPSSIDRVPQYTQELEQMGVTIVDSIDDLLKQCDAVILSSVDGRKHIAQVLPVFKSGKPVFIDKPLASNLTECIVIDSLAKHYKVNWFTSSALRFCPSIYRWREEQSLRESVTGVSAWSPCELNKFHTDLYWYGIHGVETLYTAMGKGCKSVTRVHSEDTDFVLGVWEDGRIGTFRGLRNGNHGYGLSVFTTKGVDSSGKFEGYDALVHQVAKFFVSKKAPVDVSESIEMMTFMQAADVSRERGGVSVPLDEVYAASAAQAEAQVKTFLVE